MEKCNKCGSTENLLRERTTEEVLCEKCLIKEIEGEEG